MKKIVVLLSLLSFLGGCGNMKRIYMYTPDRKQCITIFNNDEIRYIVAGKNENIPDTNYVKLDISNIDPLGDALHICWKSDTGWDIVVHRSEIIETKLDTLKYHFNTKLPTDSRGIPTEKKFRNENCAIYDFYRMKLSPDKGAIIEN